VHFGGTGLDFVKMGKVNEQQLGCPKNISKFLPLCLGLRRLSLRWWRVHIALGEYSTTERDGFHWSLSHLTK